MHKHTRTGTATPRTKSGRVSTGVVPRVGFLAAANRWRHQGRRGRGRWRRWVGFVFRGKRWRRRGLGGLGLGRRGCNSRVHSVKHTNMQPQRTGRNIVTLTCWVRAGIIPRVHFFSAPQGRGEHRRGGGDGLFEFLMFRGNGGNTAFAARSHDHDIVCITGCSTAKLGRQRGLVQRHTLGLLGHSFWGLCF